MPHHVLTMNALSLLLLLLPYILCQQQTWCGGSYSLSDALDFGFTAQSHAGYGSDRKYGKKIRCKKTFEVRKKEIQ